MGGQEPHMLRRQVLEPIVDDGGRMSCRNPIRRIACTLVECDVGPRPAQTQLVQLAHAELVKLRRCRTPCWREEAASFAWRAQYLLVHATKC